ncbi:MAG: DUF4129 domain-containing protein [Candidatus Heimdallarchaeaceae archaeon]
MFDWFKKRKRVKRLDQLFNTAMADIRIFEQRQDYRGAVIAAFGGLSNIAENLINLTRAPYQTGREFGMVVANEANISTEVMDDFLSSFEIARYTERDITYDDYQEAIQRLDVCFRGIREQGMQEMEVPEKKQEIQKKIKTRKQLKIKK